MKHERPSLGAMQDLLDLVNVSDFRNKDAVKTWLENKIAFGKEKSKDVNRNKKMKERIDEYFKNNSQKYYEQACEMNEKFDLKTKGVLI